MQSRGVRRLRCSRRGSSRWLEFEVIGVSSVLLLVGCGEQGLLPGTVDRGPDFNVAEVVYDENYFYCAVEPVLFAQRCGSGDEGDGGCHSTRTSYRLTDYAPPVGESCASGFVPTGTIPAAARQNYQSSQARMNRDPELAPLLTRALGEAAHPRVMFEADSAEANVIREWATRFSTR